MRTKLDKERQEADRWRQKYVELNQVFENYRQSKREDKNTRVGSKTSIPIFSNIQNYSPLLALMSPLKAVPNRDTIRCSVHAGIFTSFALILSLT